MGQDDILLLKDIQKNAHAAMTTIDSILDKTEDNAFTVNLARQSIGYAAIHNDAVEKLLEEGKGTYRSNQLDDLLLRGSIHANTLLNTTTSHLADMMIQGNSRGMTHIYKSLKQHAAAEEKNVELAQKLMDFEEKNMKSMKEYL